MKVVIGGDSSGATKAINDTKLSLKDMQQALKDLKSQRLDLVDADKIKDANNQIQGLSDAIKDVQHVGVEGFDALGQKIEKTKDPIRALHGEFRELREVFEGLGAIGVAGAAFEAVSKAAEFLNTVFNNTGIAAERVEKALSDGEAAGQADAVQLNSLSRIAQDSAASTDQRTAALKELQKEYPGYFANLSIEKSSQEAIQKATDDATAALLRQAKVTALTSAAGDLYKQLAAIGNDDGILTKITKKFGGLGVASLFAVKETEQYSDLNEQLKAVLAQIDKLNKESSGDKLNVKPPAADKKVADETLSYLERTKQLIEDISKADKEPLFKQFQNIDQSGIGKSVQGSIEGSLADVNYKIFQEKIKKALADAASGAISPETAKNFINAATDAFNHTKNVQLTVPIDFDLAATEDNAVNTTEAVGKKLSKSGALTLEFDYDFKESEFLRNGQKLADDMSDILNKGIQTGFEGVGDAIGKALSSGGNPLQAAGEALLGIVADVIQNIGKALIEYGIIQTGLKAVLDNPGIPGGVAIGLGVAAIAAAAILRNVAKPKHALAEGGIVTGPTTALIGEGGQPEVVFPLDKLNRFMNTDSSSNVNIQGSTRIDGNDLVIVHARATKSRGLV